jgi:DNA-binding transcriptional LysR family regulator
MLSLSELLVFLTAAETGNFTEAGRQLHLSQPAISQTMDSLEKRFGTKLFMRQGRSVKLSEAGQVLKPLARELLSAAHRLEEAMSYSNGEVIGEINVGCSTASGKYLLPGLIAQFRRKFTQVRINVLVTDRETVLNKLLAGEFSLGVSSKMIDHRNLEYQDFFKDEVILIVPSDHRWARSRTIYPDDILEEPVILREEAAGSREVLFQSLSKYNITPDMLNIAMVLGNAEGIVMAVEEGLGTAFVSRLAAKNGLECGRIVEVKVQGMPLNRRIHLIRNRRFPLTRSQSEFWSFVKASELDLKAQCTPLPFP